MVRQVVHENSIPTLLITYLADRHPLMIFLYVVHVFVCKVTVVNKGNIG